MSADGCRKMILCLKSTVFAVARVVNERPKGLLASSSLACVAAVM